MIYICPRLGSSSSRLRIDIIIYCAVAFLLTCLIVSLTLMCRHEIKKKRRTHDDLTPLQEAPPPDSTQDTPVASQGNDKKEEKHKESREKEEEQDGVGELQKVFIITVYIQYKTL